MGFKSRRSTGQGTASKSPARLAPTIEDILPLHETIRRAIIAAVEASDSLRQAAKALEMPPSSLRDKLDQFGIEVAGRRLREHRAQPAFTVNESDDS